MEKKTVWTKDLIAEKILEVVRGLDLTCMPTRNQINQYFGDDRLTNKVSKTLGYYGWAKELGLPVQENDTRKGKLAEIEVANWLRDLGYEVKQMLQNYPFDLLINNTVKVDVKFSNLGQDGNGYHYYSYAIRKPYPTCDLYILVAHREGEDRYFIVPSKEVMQQQITIGEHQSIYNQYLFRLDILDQYISAFKAVG